MQPTITFPGALKLIMWLPGEKAKIFRSKIAEILKRYFAGDLTLLDDIQANAASSAPLNQFARAAMNDPEPSPQQAQVPDEEVSALKRRRIEHTLYAESLREANPLFEKRLKLQVKFYDHRERWLAMELKSDLERLEMQRKQNEMELDKERKQNEIELEKQQGILNIERDRLAILNDGRNQELAYKRALKSLDAADPVPDPAATTTVLKVYLAHKDAFPLLKPDQRRSFLAKAGTRAADAYALRHGVQPHKVQEQDHHVNAYPCHAEPLLLDALRASYRDHAAGGAQTTLYAAFIRPSPGE